MNVAQGWFRLASGVAGISFLLANGATGQQASDAGSLPAANPARPTVTIPAALTPTGYVHFEQGFVRAGASPGGTAGQSALSQTTKVALTGRLLVQFLSQPYAYSRVSDASGRVSGRGDPGDLHVGAQGLLCRAFAVTPAVAVGFIRRVRTGTSASLDAGEFSQEALVQAGGDVRGGFHYDGNLLFDEQSNGQVRRAQFGQTLALTKGLFFRATRQRLGGIVELSHFTQPFTTASRGGSPVARADAIDLLFAGTWTPRPNLIVDASVVRGLTSTSTNWQGGFGFSYLLPHRLVPARR